MAYQLTFDDPGRDTNTFYRRTLHVLSDARVPFLVGGSHAILHYTGIIRETKDFDLFVRRADVEKALESLALAGYWTQITFPHWLAKAKQGTDHVDLVFSSACRSRSRLSRSCSGRNPSCWSASDTMAPTSCTSFARAPKA
jgi:hypothetical protein